MLIATIYLLAGVQLVAYRALRPRRLRFGRLLTDAYLIGIALYCAGCILVAATDPTQYDATIGLASALALFGAMSGLLVTELVGCRISPATPVVAHETLLGELLVDGAFVVSLLATIFFALVAMRGGLTVGMVVGIVAGPAGELASFRKDVASSGAGGLSAGLIKQFRDILLPWCMAALFFRWSGARRLLLLLPLGICGVSMLLSGQRLPLLVLMAGAISVVWQSGVSRRVKIAIGSVIVAMVMALILGLSLALGRVTQTQSTAETAGNVLLALADRALAAAPRENMRAVPALKYVPTSGGRQMLSDVMILLPGKQTSLSSSLHAELYGSNRGNSVLGLPADLFVNWGFAGVVIASSLYAILISLVDRRLTRRATPFARAVRTFLWISLPFMYSPYLFLLYGGIVVLVVIALPFPRIALPDATPTPQPLS